MPDLTEKFLPRLQENALPVLDLGPSFIAPSYADQSILNIPATVCKLLGIPGIGAGELNPNITAALGTDIQRVIVILMDGLALHRFQNWLKNAPVWNTLIKEGVLAPLTSVVPSTTSSALTTLWTGCSPAQHGIIGYEMFTKEFSMISNMILHAPMTFSNDIGGLERAGFAAEEFLPVPTFGPHLKAHGLTPYGFMHYSIANSGLSRMFMRDVDIIPIETPASTWVGIRQLIEAHPDERQYIWTYWSAVDGISHFHGPDDERVPAEFSSYSRAFEEFFLNQLNPQLRQGTAVILTADHGQRHTPLEANNVLQNHPELHRHLRLNPTCENRLANLYLRPGREAAVREYIEKTWPEEFTLIPQTEALGSELFGPGPQHVDLENRIGDLIAVAHEGAYLWWADKPDFLQGRHGGLTPEEMIVPFLGARL
jgi:hypothetical protein